jgi:hypothetical protein
LLKDSEPNEQQTENTIKKDDKNKKGPPAKQVKDVNEQLKEELEAIRKMEVNGFILVGFPRTLT